MLIVKIVNDATGTDKKSNYRYQVYVNENEISSGRIEGHNRKNGWRKLLKEISKQGSPKKDEML